MDQIKAPFTVEQVKHLNAFQACGFFHPFTCKGQPFMNCERKNGEGGVLIATRQGWFCPCTKYSQDWAHKFMGEKLPELPPEFSKLFGKK